MAWVLKKLKMILDNWFYQERCLCASITVWEHENTSKYPRLGVSRDSIQMKSTIDFILMKSKMLMYVMDDQSVNEVHMCISEYYV